MDFLPSFLAAYRVVPEPDKGSRTVAGIVGYGSAERLSDLHRGQVSE